MTSTAVTFGYVYAPNSAAEQAALGNTAGAQNDPSKLVNAVVADVNSHGGVAHRKLNVAYYTYQASSTATQSEVATLEQQICAHYTQDSKALMVVNFATPAVIKCLGAAGTLSTAAGANFSDAEYASYTNYFDTSAGSIDQLCRNLVTALLQANYFTPWNTTLGQSGGTSPVKVGILAPDDPTEPGLDPTVEKVLIPDLAAHGIRVNPQDVVFWDNSSNQNAVAGIDSAELKFASDHVTHVIPLDVSSLAFFSTNAETQHYRPRYGVNSLDYAYAEAGTLVPTAQLNGAAGLGFEPSVDLSTSESARPQYTGPGAAHCEAVMHAHNIDIQSQSNLAQALLICDSVYVFAKALNAIPAGDPVNEGSVMQALDSLGSSYPAAGLPAATYGPQKHYPLAIGWVMEWSAGCECLQYQGGGFRLH